MSQGVRGPGQEARGEEVDPRRFAIEHALLHRGGGVDAAWSNLGDWERATSYAAACEALARRVGEAAGLGPGDRVLDVGFGEGDSLLLWREAFGVALVHGREVRPDSVRRARRRVEARGQQAHLTPHLGSATHLDDLPPGSFDKVVCVDAAYHFPPREHFFREALRVLAPGGRLALTDLALAARPRGAWGRWLVERAARACAIPPANLCTPEEYRRGLEAAGYTEVRLTFLDAQVLAGFARFVSRHRREHLWRAPSAGWGKVLVTGWACGMLGRRRHLHYLLVTATRPG